MQDNIFGIFVKNYGSIKISYSEGNKLNKVISNENEFMIKNEEINNLVEENNKKIMNIHQLTKKLLGQDYNNEDNNDNNSNNDLDNNDN